jgi:hypothetical protein
VIAAQLIVGPAVRRAQEEALELGGIGLDSEGDTHEAARILGCIQARDTRKRGLDHPIPQRNAGGYGHGLVVGWISAGLHEPDGWPAAIGDEFGQDVAQLQLA